MGDKPTLTPWRIRLEADDVATIYDYQDKPRNLALGQYAQLFMLSSWQIVQQSLKKIDYQSRRGY